MENLQEWHKKLEARFVEVTKLCRIAQKAYFAASKEQKDKRMAEMRQAENKLVEGLSYMRIDTKIEFVGSKESNLLELVEAMLQAQARWIKHQDTRSKEKAMAAERAVDEFLKLPIAQDPNQITLF